ncbi:MAG: metallophosphoesterase [Atribacterota bacterium]
MKFILLADTHIGLNKDNSIFHNVTINLFNEIKKVSVEQNIQDIAILGDVFHSRKILSSRSKDTAYEIFRKILIDNSVILVSGNHDIYYKEKYNPNWLEIFYDCGNVSVVDCWPKIYDNCIFVPWGYPIYEIENKEDLYLFGHFEINSFLMNDSYECKNSKLNISDFKDFKHVYSGHFHTPSSNGNITYIGSPFQQTFHDVNSARGYYIFDDGDLEFIEFTSAPKFIKLKASETINEEDVRRNFVKIIFKDESISEIEKTVALIESYKPVSLNTATIIDNQDVIATEEIETQSNEEIFMNYVSSIKRPDHIKVEVLKTLFDMFKKDIENDV